MGIPGDVKNAIALGLKHPLVDAADQVAEMARPSSLPSPLVPLPLRLIASPITPLGSWARVGYCDFCGDKPADIVGKLALALNEC